MPDGPDDEGHREGAAGVLDLAAHEREVGPAVVGPHDGDQGGRDQRDVDARAPRPG